MIGRHRTNATTAIERSTATTRAKIFKNNNNNKSDSSHAKIQQRIRSSRATARQSQRKCAANQATTRASQDKSSSTLHPIIDAASLVITRIASSAR